MKQDEQKFEHVISELEGIVQELDSSIGLEDSLKKFARGMELAQVAEERLKTIENKFQKIQQDFSKGNEPKTMPLALDEALAPDPTESLETIEQ